MSGPGNYLPVQRISQACLQCRRKKCRCTGDRPICAQCRRLGTDCVYGDENPRPPQPSRARQDEDLILSPESSSALDMILNKLSTLEHKLDKFGSRLNDIESHLSSSASLNQLDRTAGPNSHPAADNIDRLNGSARQDDNAKTSGDGTPEDVLTALVDAYFYFCHNQPYSFFHEAQFRRDWAEQKVPAHLLLSMMATAARFCTHPYFSGRTYEMSVEYATRAWKLIVADCFTPGKVTEKAMVQTVALLGLFDFTADRPRHGSAWVKVGMAVRIAQDCELMLENATHLSFLEQEERRRVFWSVYLLDRLVSCGRGRPPAILDSSCHLQLPCEESAWKNGSWEKTQSLDEVMNRALPVPRWQSSFAQVITIAQILGRSSQYMLQEFNIRSPHPPWDPSSDFAALESDLLHHEMSLEMQRPLREVLAPHINAEGVVDYHSAGPIIFSRAFYHLCYCLLNHPFLLKRRINTCLSQAPSSFVTRSLDLGWLHAQQMVELIREARELGCSFHSSSSGYCFTVAGSIIALRTYDEDPFVGERAKTLLQEVLAFLDLIGQHWHNVASMGSGLRRIVLDGFSGNNFFNRQSNMTPLTYAEEKTMWTVVDYNTMSSQVIGEDTEIGQAAMDMWPEVWTDLFGGFDFQLVASTVGVGIDPNVLP